MALPAVKTLSDCSLRRRTTHTTAMRVWKRGDREWPLNDRHRPHFRDVRVAPGTGYGRGRGTGWAWRNGEGLG
jgi:hypothetical protein